MNELDAWIAAACAELGLQPDEVKAKAVLDVARDVAHQVIRPGAPVSAYLMGLAVGRGADASDVAARLSALALSWPKDKPSDATAEPSKDAGRPSDVAAGPREDAAGRGKDAGAPKDDKVPSRNRGELSEDTGAPREAKGDLSSRKGQTEPTR